MCDALGLIDLLGQSPVAVDRLSLNGLEQRDHLLSLLFLQDRMLRGFPRGLALFFPEAMTV